MMGVDDTIEIEDHQLHGFEEIFEQAFTKLTTNLQLKDLFDQQESSLLHNPVSAVLGFGSKYQTPFLTTVSLPGTCVEKLGLDFFFHYQDGHYFFRHFLFGTPSQKRTRSP